MKKLSDAAIACIAFCVLCCLFLFPLFLGHIADTSTTVKIITGILILFFTVLMTVKIVSCRSAGLKEKVQTLENQLSGQQHTKLSLYEIQQQLREITNSVNNLSCSPAVSVFSERVDEKTKAQRKEEELYEQILSNAIRLLDIPFEIRMSVPAVYTFAFRTSRNISRQRYDEDLNVLREDIQCLNQDPKYFNIKEILEDRLTSSIANLDFIVFPEDRKNP